MNTVKNTSEAVQAKEARNPCPRPTISTQRWTSRPTQPRLVSFSWGAVSPMATQR